MIDRIGFVIVATGFIFDLLAAVSLFRFPDACTRISASTKCITLGTSAILFGVFVIHGFSPAGVKALVCLVFILLTSPVEAHALLKAAHRSGAKLWKGSIINSYEDDKK